MSLYSLAAREGCMPSTLMHEVNQKRHDFEKDIRRTVEIGLFVMNMGFVASHASEVGLAIALGARAYEAYIGHGIKRQIRGHKFNPDAGICWHEDRFLKDVESAKRNHVSWFHNRTMERMRGERPAQG